MSKAFKNITFFGVGLFISVGATLVNEWRTARLHHERIEKYGATFIGDEIYFCIKRDDPRINGSEVEK